MDVDVNNDITRRMEVGNMLVEHMNVAREPKGLQHLSRKWMRSQHHLYGKTSKNIKATAYIFECLFTEQKCIGNIMGFKMTCSVTARLDTGGNIR